MIAQIKHFDILLLENLNDKNFAPDFIKKKVTNF